MLRLKLNQKLDSIVAAEADYFSAYDSKCSNFALRIIISGNPSAYIWQSASRRLPKHKRATRRMDTLFGEPRMFACHSIGEGDIDRARVLRT